MAEPKKPLDEDGYLQILQNVTPPDYYEPFFSTDPEKAGSGRIYQAMARTQSKIAAHIYRAIEARYFRTHSTSNADPSSTWRFARGQVRMKRTSMLHDPRFVEAKQGGSEGAMILRGPSGRLYTNEHSVLWTANDPVTEKDITFRCLVPGTVGNLDFYADDGELISLEAAGAAPNSAPDLSIVYHENLSDQRSGREASVTAPLAFNRASVIMDNGKPDQFATSHKDLYVEILDSANPENIGRFLRIMDVTVSMTQVPPGSGLYPHRIFVDDRPSTELLLAAKLDDGGVFTDYTTASQSDVADDVPLVPLVPAVDDAFYFGAKYPFLGVVVGLSTAGTGEWTVAWEYWDGGAWELYPDTVDETQSFHAAGSALRVEAPTLPNFWAVTTVDGVAGYWIRARVTQVVNTDVQPLAAKLGVLKPIRLTVETGTLSWAVRDWRELGFEITSVAAFSGGRDNELGALADERGVTVKDGESDESLRRRVQSLADVVSPVAIKRAVDRQLAPYNLVGYTWDVQNGLTGLFADVDFTDYYSPGDLFPIDKQKLIDSDTFSYGWFLVFVPILADGEFGGFADEGPVIWLESKQTFLASAADLCFADGYPTKADGVYQAIWEQVNAIRAFGVGFSIVLSSDLNVPPC